jgi:hypothetical protein
VNIILVSTTDGHKKIVMAKHIGALVKELRVKLKNTDIKILNMIS